MPPLPSFGRLDTPPPKTDKAPGPETPFRIGVLGDFSGRANRGETADLAGRKAYTVTREAFDELPDKVTARLRLPVPDGDDAELAFRSLDDFHPDEVHDRVAKFEDCYDDDEKTALMSALLHHADFQALESAWRGLDWLLRRVQKRDGGVEVVLYDISQAELAADLTATEDLATTKLYRVLVDPAGGGDKGKPWGALVGLYPFDLSAAHAGLLGRLAKIAARAAAPFLAGGPVAAALDPEFTPGADDTAAWEALRALPEAALLGLGVPRFLLRLPYGSNTKSIDRFAYEEFTGPTSRSGYLWGNPALACAALLGAAFVKQGWALKPGELLDLEGMPMHVYTRDDEQEVTLAEAWLTRPSVEKLVKLGLMPLLNVKGKDAVQLFRVLSVAKPPKGQQASDLGGRWGGTGAVKPARTVGPPGVSVGFGASGAPAPARAPAAGRDNGEAVETPAAESEETPAASPGEEAEAPPAEEEMDPELAALLQQLDQGAAAPAEPAPAAAEEMDPELAALMKQLEESSSGPAETPPEQAAAEEMDPELAALMKQLEGESAPDTPPAEEAAPAAEAEVDPELAALMKQLKGETAPSAPVAEEAVAAEAEVDPELAALMKQLEGEAAPSAPVAEEAATAEMDPDLAALMGELGQGSGAVAEPESAAVPAADEEVDPELAALMQQLEAGDESAPSTAEAEPAPEAPPTTPADEEVDPELAALMRELEQGSPAESEQDELGRQIESLGGLAALADLGWPEFARSFREDRDRQLRLLEGKIRNRAAEREVRRLVRQCGGYTALAEEGVTPDLGLNAQLERLRAIRVARERAVALTNEELLLMAAAYGARLKGQKTDEAKAGLLLMVRDYDRWASDPRFEDAAVTVARAPFEQRRQAQLEHQFQHLGGARAYRQLLAAYPDGADAEAPLEQKVALLRALRAYTWLGGDAAYAERVGADGAGPLTVRLEKLRAVVTAQE